jgi:hypothetical protein
MLFLKVLELVFTVLWLGFMLSEVVIPMCRQIPLFPSFRRVENAKTAETEETVVQTKKSKEKKNA